ncbi:pyridine nucleotide-disulfide oxidoreductase, partial [Clostridium perfringens]|nr:pyridine nucleotide-disulfide oxidoreductase [Clostridium perfringens]
MAKEKVLDLANKIAKTKRGSKSEITENHPEYKALEPVVTEKMAEVALYLEFRKPQSVEEVAALCGKSVEETSKILWELAVAGACLVGNKDGV